MSEEKITPEELSAITEAAVKRNTATQVAERAVLEARNAELQHQVTVQHVFMKYGLTFNDKIDDNTGIITRNTGVITGGENNAPAETPEEESAE